MWRWLGLLLFCPFVLAGEAHYRLGVGLFYAQLPDYPGSAERSAYLLPFPYFTYCSERLYLDQTEASGRLIQQGNWSLNISLAGSLPVNSNNNTQRSGMHDLHWIGEAGPSLDYHFLRLPTQRVSLHLPLRAAVATDIRYWQNLGWRFEPQLRWQKKLSDKWRWDNRLSASWSSQRYHQYLYGIDSNYVNEQRPFYQPEKGFSGWRISSGLSWQHSHWSFGSFIRYDNLQQTSFYDSPLVIRQHNFSFGLAIARILKQQ